MVGDEESAECLVEDDCGEEADAGARNDGERQDPRHLEDGFVGAVEQHNFERQQCGGGADGVDQNALGTEDRPGRAGGANEAEERADHGRAGHDEYGAEHNCSLIRDAENFARRVPADQEADHGADGDQSADDDAGVTQLARRKVEAALEKNEGNRERHEREEIAAEQFIWIDDASDGTE